MRSVGTRGVTVVTVITLVFTPTFHGHHWVKRLLGVEKETTVVACQPGKPCPRHTVIVRKVERP